MNDDAMMEGIKGKKKKKKRKMMTMRKQMMKRMMMSRTRKRRRRRSMPSFPYPHLVLPFRESHEVLSSAASSSPSCSRFFFVSSSD